MSDVTQLLNELQADGADRHTVESQLMEMVYLELRRMAARRMNGEAPDHTLTATALVQETYLRMIGNREQSWQNRAHFFSAAAEAMRRILIDNARRKGSLKRGGGQTRDRVNLDQLGTDDAFDLIALNDALDRLAEQDADAARLVKLRYFAGLTIAEIAETLETSPRTARRLWDFARAWLYTELEP